MKCALRLVHIVYCSVQILLLSGSIKIVNLPSSLFHPFYYLTSMSDLHNSVWPITYMTILIYFIFITVLVVRFSNFLIVFIFSIIPFCYTYSYEAPKPYTIKLFHFDMCKRNAWYFHWLAPRKAKQLSEGWIYKHITIIDTALLPFTKCFGIIVVKTFCSAVWLYYTHECCSS